MSQLEQLIGAMDAVTTGRGRTTQPDDRLEGVASEDDSDDEASQMEKQMAVARMQEQMARAMAFQAAQHNPNGVTVMNVGGPKPNIIPMSALDPAQMAQLAAQPPAVSRSRIWQSPKMYSHTVRRSETPSSRCKRYSHHSHQISRLRMQT